MCKTASLLGLAMKAGKLESGEFLTERAVKSRRAALVVVAADASDNTKKVFSDMCAYYSVPIYFWGSKEELGAAVGKEYRSVAAVTDAGLSDAVVRQMENE